MTSRWYQPDEQETQRLLNTALRLADGDAALVDNHLFSLLFNHDTGIYARKNRPSLWELDAKGGWVRIKRRMSRRQWIEVYFVIQRKNGTLGPLKLNRAQRRIEANILRMERANLPIRLVLLKARQQGFSSYVQAVMFEMELRETRVKGLIVADTGDRAETLLSIADTARAEMPKLGDNERWEFGMRSKAVYSLVWREPMLGQLRITSAEVREPGRGGTRKIVHMSETGHWQDAPLKMPGVLASLPTLPFTYGFNESTANGEGNQFAEDFWRGWEQRATPLHRRTFLWQSLFFAWWEHEEYFWSKTVGGGRDPDPKMLEAIAATLDTEEEQILACQYWERGTPSHAWEEVDRKVGKRTVKVWRRVGIGWKKVSLDQIAWYRMKLEDPECHGDKNLRGQEYPWCPEIAFLVTGRKVFDARLLAEHAAKAPDPVWQGWIDAPLGAPPDPLVDEILDEVQRPQ